MSDCRGRERWGCAKEGSGVDLAQQYLEWLSVILRFKRRKSLRAKGVRATKGLAPFFVVGSRDYPLAHGRWSIHEVRPGVLRMYVGPEALMPLASALAAIAGFLLMFSGRRVVGAARSILQFVAGKRGEAPQG